MSDLGPAQEKVARSPLQDVRLHAPATQRNRQPILEALSRALPTSGTVLEIASGTGEHAAWFAQQLRPLAWQPSDPDPDMRRSIAAHAADALRPTLKDPLDLDVHKIPWPIETAGAVVCINMTHIAPWSATEALARGASRILGQDGVLFLYGPFHREGQPTATSNAAFDSSLRAENPDWGLRDLEAVSALAEATGFSPPSVIEMPANNLSVVFTKTAD